MSAVRDDALATLRSWEPPSAHQDALRERFLAHLQARSDAAERSCVPEHLTASTLVLDEAREHALLTLHAKSGRWFQFGGHCEPTDTTLAGAALREATEESGLGAHELCLLDQPVLLDAHYVPFCGPDGVWHLDVMHVATAPDHAQPSRSEESLEVAWWPVANLPNLELTGFVAHAVARLG